MKRTKIEQHIIEIWQNMGNYQDFIEFLSGVTKSIGIQCDKVKELPDTIEENVMLNDLIQEYNQVERIHYTKAYIGCFKSKKSKDAGKYVARFKKEVFKAVSRKYASGFRYANIEHDDLLHTLKMFFDLLLS